METTYTVDYFIDKFSKIPEDMWCVKTLGDMSGSHCALGHCDFGNTGVPKEALALQKLLKPLENSHCRIWTTPWINDGLYPSYQQPTPKQRILAALNDIKKMQEPVKERIVYVTVDESVRELQQKELKIN